MTKSYNLTFYNKIGDDMKKLLLIVLLLLMYLLISQNTSQAKKEEELKGVFISYIELNKYLKTDEEKSKENIRKMIHNIQNMKLNTIILQVRAASDAIYPSKIYPTSMYIVSKEGDKSYDVLKYFLQEAHKKDMKVIAWINPYRIRTTDDIASISKKNPAYQYLNTNTIYQKNGIYFNPAKEEVTKLIIDGVKELLNYPIDGLLMDDYFYPSDDIDEDDYQKYLEIEPNMTKQEYHLKIINQMVEKVHKECQKKNIKFGVSPDGNMENNYQKNYADIKKWMSEDNYIDFIMPQIYYGFYNSTKAYYKVAKEWESYLTNDKIDLLIALAFYKVGIEDFYAKEGKNEWLQNSNIIMREIILSRNLKNYQGFALFRYDNIFDPENYNSNSISEIENMKKIIK